MCFVVYCLFAGSIILLLMKPKRCLRPKPKHLIIKSEAQILEQKSLIQILEENEKQLQTALYCFDKKFLAYVGMDKNRWVVWGEMALTVNRMKNKSVNNAWRNRYSRYADCLERIKCDLELINSYDEIITKNNATSLIQIAWKECISNPSKTICRRRLLKEFEQLETISN